jgi:hypothetical protein
MPPEIYRQIHSAITSNNKVKKLLILLWLALAFASCRAKPDNTWLASSACEAPCWHDIAPGETTLSETNALLNSNPVILSNTIGFKGSSWQKFDDFAYFGLQNSRVEGEIYFLDNRVSMLTFDTTVDGQVGPFLGILLGELIDKYGEPQYLLKINVPSGGGDSSIGCIRLFT